MPPAAASGTAASAPDHMPSSAVLRLCAQTPMLEGLSVHTVTPASNVSVAEACTTSSMLSRIESCAVTAALQPFVVVVLTVNSPATNKEDVFRWAAGGAGFAIAIAALGGTLAQGRATAAALEGISRNPGASAKIQTPMILGLALIESLVLFAFVIAFLLQGQIKL